MRSDGYTVIELLLAAAVLLVATAAAFRLLDDGVARSAMWNESADLNQRGRVAIDLLSATLSAAGAGSDSGSLPRFLAAVDPRRRTSGGAVSNAITVRSVPVGAPRAALAAMLAPGTSVATLVRHSGCPDGSTACGFVAGMDVIVFDTAGNWDTVLVQSIAPDAVVLVDRPVPRTATYPAGAQLMQIVETTLYLEESDGTLRREHAGASNLPLIDNVVDLSFEYVGETSPPVFPRPPAGTANCLFDSAGAPIPHPSLTADHGQLASLPISMLADGPFCGTGASAYDMDLLRVRKIRVFLALQTGVAILRGADRQLFARPGGARLSGRMLPDLRLSLVITPRNLQQ